MAVRLPFAWRRFPYALTAVGAAPRGVPGPFRVVSATPRRLVLRSSGLTLVVSRLRPLAAVAAFRRGELDEAPIPLGDLGALRLDPSLRGTVHVRLLLALDLVEFGPSVPAALRRAYWRTADRADYAALVPESPSAAAFGIAPSSAALSPSEFRATLHSIPSLPAVRVRIGVPPTSGRYAAGIVYGQWREVGLGPQLVSAAASPDARLLRVAAAYPQEEALAGAVTPARGFLGLNDQHAALGRVDAALRDGARVVPIAWVSDARLVSPRLRGWREDVLGDVDYAAVRAR